MDPTSATSDDKPRVEIPRVLVVQPDRSYLGLLSRRIGEGGYRVATADSAASAMAELHRLPIDLILSELRMPKLGGVELTRMLREEPVHREIPMFLITGKSDAEGAVQAYKCGVDAVIAKPFDFDVLLARIAREIERSRSLSKLLHDNATLDARVVGRAIELGELRERWLESQAELRRLRQVVGNA
jgi:two-component system, OmpR family, phosphate regulon response regulator PhoB